MTSTWTMITTKTDRLTQQLYLELSSLHRSLSTKQYQIWNVAEPLSRALSYASSFTELFKIVPPTPARVRNMAKRLNSTQQRTNWIRFRLLKNPLFRHEPFEIPFPSFVKAREVSVKFRSSSRYGSQDPLTATTTAKHSSVHSKSVSIIESVRFEYCFGSMILAWSEVARVGVQSSPPTWEADWSPPYLVCCWLPLATSGHLEERRS